MTPYNRALLVTLLTGGLSAAVSAQDASNNADAQEQAAESITVYGRQTEDSVKKIPQSVSVFSDESFNLVFADRVGDVLRLLPNIAPAGSSLDMFADNVLIRGFDAEQSTNGLGFTRTDHPTDTANVERIEVLKGPASVLYGQMEPGGTVNTVTKQPLPYFFAEAGLELGSDSRARTTLDVTGPINDSVRARLNLAYQESEDSTDNWDNERVFIAPNVTVDLSEKTNLTIEGSYSNNDWTAMQGGAPLEGSILPNPNGDYSKSFNVSADDSFTERDSQNTNIRLTHALTDKINARASYTYLKNEADWQEYAYWELNDDNRTVDRIIFAGQDTYKKDKNLILDINGEVDTGSLTHKFIVGLDHRKSEMSRPTQIYFIDSIDLYNPQYTALDLASADLARDRTTLQDGDVSAFFVQDRVTLMDSLHLMAGLRYIDSKQTQTTVNNASGSSSTDSISQTDWTSQLGVVYDLNKDMSIFANRSESFVPQQGTTSGSVPLDAEEGVQYEMGMRFNVGKLQANIAGFVITKDNIAIEDPLDDDFEVAEGKARSKGVELTLSGYVSPNLYMMAAYGYTDTEILRSDDDELVGNSFANVPLHTASLQSRYYIGSLPGLSVGGTLAYLGGRYGDDDNSFELPSHTRTDLTAAYEVNDSLQAEVLVSNVFDEGIYSPGSFDGVVREPGRTFKARVKYNF
ncbi:TonB-dependent siderophore receptor [Oceanospirillum beijerinckii]|uniref:TonB-dependent siderophore receptor n=1 Tax=Oceanospirillum beijerinckii TaxID=64976 RepID=UPI00040209B1|nr:TonB-dependent siderophore receptor [Oceanospirillum beijerinckii]